MSFIATMLFKGGIRPGVFSTWVQTAALNFPMALLWQFFVAGPLARLIFREKNERMTKSPERGFFPFPDFFARFSETIPPLCRGE